MKRIFTIVLAVACVFALCSCTPDVSDIKDTFKENGYNVTELDAVYATTFGAKSNDVDYVFLAIGNGNASTVYVFAFCEVDKAKEFEKKQSEKIQANFKIKRKGKVVIFGSEQGVELF